MVSSNEHIENMLHTLPTKPGCYLMKDRDGKIIYVGKAINLRSRVRSYFQSSTDQSLKTKHLVRDIADIDWIVVGSELEALILEMNLIKKHRPHYNVRLKDDKRYPYIKVHWEEAFPRVTVTRNLKDDGGKYYGPYTSVWAMHQTLDLLRKIFQYRTCDRVITGSDARACLYYDIKLCSAPCIGMINEPDYNQMLHDLGKFLEGETEPILDRLQEIMQKMADALEFEKAANLRDQINAIERVVEKQKVVSTRNKNSDVVAMARSNGDACVQIFFIRSGKLIGHEYFILEGADDEKDSEVISQFMMQFYSQSTYIPSEVLLPKDIEEAVIIQQWLNQKKDGEKIELKVPRRGTSKQLVEMATENAVETLRSLKSQWEMDTHKQSVALTELQAALGMPKPPNRMECYDISNTQGTASVGSMVVFEQGVPNKKLYRRFNIKSVDQPDDFASMEEVLARRFRRWQAYHESTDVGKKAEPSFSVLPDLLIVDGGKGQLSRALKVLDEFDLRDTVQAVGLAKSEELVILPDQDKPLALPRNSQGLFLMQRIRDEAHRFAITAHRDQRSKNSLKSVLDEIPGIGPARKKALLAEFGSVENLRRVSVEDIAKLPGINHSLAEEILRSIQ
ncbi:MAG TPA: excinuclease ABC subunit C [Anaerolineaceae bacterium]|uniref:UvrABC system protein C n=1 Tax=Anaerolinea thermophila TaxID=167964 RepID=A0A101FY29_9CHLR|nr:MAG: UvrABC system protein C [Anaerolinea thermophila]HAF61043.1 excinuclease ABC subunit C [Anaerolineaceae bacterium]